MHAKAKLGPLLLLGASLALPACENVAVDTTGSQTPPSGVIRGTVSYVGPPPCSQNGHIVGNAVILVFDATNPPPPGGLANTALNFGVISGDVLFADWPAAQGATKVCPDSSAPTQTVSAPYVIAPIDAGQYQIQAFFDYTGDFFATFKFRNLPEATDVGGGYIDIDQATALVPNSNATPIAVDGGSYYPPIENQTDPNYLPVFQTITVGNPGPVSPISLRGVPTTFTMPDTGYVADNVTVTIAQTLTLSRPYFYPEGVNSTSLTSLSPNTTEPPLSNIVYNGLSSTRPPSPSSAASASTPQNPSGDPDFVPIIQIPQDFQVYAQPTLNGVIAASVKGQANVVALFDQYQAALPSIVLHAGVPAPEVPIAADVGSLSDPFHMQLGIAGPPGSQYAPGGNGGFYVWWNAPNTFPCSPTEPLCDAHDMDYLVEAPGNAFRMWPLIVLAKLDDLPAKTSQPNPNDPEAIVAQGTDLTKPIVIIQGITLYEDSFFQTTIAPGELSGAPNPPAAPDLVGQTNRYDHVTALVRPSALCMDPRAPDQGGVLVTTGAIKNIAPATQPPQNVVLGSFDPIDQAAGGETGQPIVIDSANLENPQLDQLVNRNAAGSTHGLMGGCLPTGRYEINVVYPTGQAWTTPNETGSCAAAEGNTLFSGSGTPVASAPGSGQFLDPLTSGCSASAPAARPVLYSQGTRAVIEITPATSQSNCTGFAANPLVNPDGSAITNGVPFVCSGLCSDPSLDATANPPCSQCLNKNYSPTAPVGGTPCTVPVNGTAVHPAH